MMGFTLLRRCGARRWAFVRFVGFAQLSQIFELLLNHLGIFGAGLFALRFFIRVNHAYLDEVF